MPAKPKTPDQPKHPKGGPPLAPPGKPKQPPRYERYPCSTRTSRTRPGERNAGSVATPDPTSSACYRRDTDNRARQATRAACVGVSVCVGIVVLVGAAVVLLVHASMHARSRRQACMPTRPLQYRAGQELNHKPDLWASFNRSRQI
jgi:hypothetical protein